MTAYINILYEPDLDTMNVFQAYGQIHSNPLVPPGADLTSQFAVNVHAVVASGQTSQAQDGDVLILRSVLQGKADACSTWSGQMR
jgi:hypothetical protein